MRIPLTQFDLMIVYANDVAQQGGRGKTLPFFSHEKQYGAAYRFFLQQCKKQGLVAAFTTVDAIIGHGLFSGYWTYTGKQWQWHNTPAYSAYIVNRFYPFTLKEKRLYSTLTSQPSIRVFKGMEMDLLFKDKIRTYTALNDISIPTVLVKQLNYRGLQAAKKKLDGIIQQHVHQDDFFNEYILKDRFGYEGKNIYKIDFQSQVSLKRIIQAVPGTWKHNRFILQPYIRHDRGFSFGHFVGKIDLRLMFLNEEIVQCYIRIAKPGEYRSNAAQGGHVVHIPVHRIPLSVRLAARRIAKRVPKPAMFYALDFIRSNSGRLYLMEGNSNPAIIWYNAEDAKRTKQNIQRIVHAIYTCINKK